jgi:2',3'-cyclic-nucleotide 2'-phosphodiesterase (5'-nucleotidase family)
MSRRSFLHRAGGVVLGLFGLSNRQAFTDQGRAMKLTILHTNDIHGHLTAWKGWEGDLKDKTVGGLGRLAGAIAQARKETKDALLLDAGDLLGDSMIADLTEGKAMVEALNHLGYDAMSIGNHEPDFGTDVLRQRMKDATFTVLAANLIERNGRKPFAKPYIIKKVSGVSVGILGLAYPKTAWTTAAKNVAEVEFQNPVPAVKHYLPKMRHDGAELIVVLSHLGLGGDKALAKAVEGIDVIVGGHSHNRMQKAEEVGTTLIVQAGAHGSDLGRLELTIEQGKVTANVCTLTPLDHDTVKADDDAERLLTRLLDPHHKAMDEIVGKAADWLVRAQTLAGQQARQRDEESPIDSLFADILREQTGADVALLPGVGYGVAIPTGAITAAQLRQMVPHEGKVVTMRLSGTQIIEALEQAVENVFTDDPAVKVGGMIQVGGIRFRYDPKLAKGHRVWHVDRTAGRWNPLDEYTVVTNTMMAGGGHNYQALTKGEKREEHGSQYEMIRLWMARQDTVTTPPSGRIEKVAMNNKPQ